MELCKTCKYDPYCLMHGDKEKCSEYAVKTDYIDDVWRFIDTLYEIKHSCIELSDCEECAFNLEGACLLMEIPYKYNIELMRNNYLSQRGLR